MRMYDKRCLAKERSPVGEGRGKRPNLRAKGYIHTRGERDMRHARMLWARAKFVTLSCLRAKQKGRCLPSFFALLVETTSRSPHGESVLQKRRNSF